MTQTNEELREKIHNLLGEHNIVFSQNFIDDLYALIPKPEQSKEPESNYVSLVNGSGTHCKECGKRL